VSKCQRERYKSNSKTLGDLHLIDFVCEEVHKENWNNTGETGTAGFVVVEYTQIDKEGKIV
jgi:hypothetical protein